MIIVSRASQSNCSDLPAKASSRLPPGKKSYINSFEVGELQYPRRFTRCLCLMLPRISSSLSKNLSKPSLIFTILFKANTLPSSISSLYTVPNPPEPIICSSFKDSNFLIISFEEYGKSPWNITIEAPGPTSIARLPLSFLPSLL
nr:hypothetical protein Iba_scaffold43298CG0590 [Ipomoea batatas]GMD84728.1 hypothetical protein Iba_chr14aCG17460 [Ipomoea batatas]GMD89318.1 hypothetical protein Iba_chr14cCG15640 [Ipomoea batatas]GME11873.1 hypothetical protein Iba_scaffold12822CG0010 [Ipomoea batatas]GME20136.1 hypothetical protein Iba_scaffold24386.2CG0890 [Ipomoea batatas]